MEFDFFIRRRAGNHSGAACCARARQGHIAKGQGGSGSNCRQGTGEGTSEPAGTTCERARREQELKLCFIKF
jgi:hypothetical protein